MPYVDLNEEGEDDEEEKNQIQREIEREINLIKISRSQIKAFYVQLWNKML